MLEVWRQFKFFGGCLRTQFKRNGAYSRGRVHAYKMHEYDAAPKKDARNARHVANDLRRETQAWIQNHAEAKYGNDPRIRKLVNNQREKVEAEYKKLRVTIFELPGRRTNSGAGTIGPCREMARQVSSIPTRIVS